jgi:hypothetical protein
MHKQFLFLQGTQEREARDEIFHAIDRYLAKMNFDGSTELVPAAEMGRHHEIQFLLGADIRMVTNRVSLNNGMVARMRW